MSQKKSAQVKAKPKKSTLKGRTRSAQQGGKNLNSLGKQMSHQAYSAYAMESRGSPPNISMGSKGASCRVRHRELVTNISGSVAFAVALRLALNPGLAATFPWLSSIAASWEKYKFHKLAFKYLTRTGSTTPGSVILAPDYDASDGPPASEQIVSAFSDLVEDVPWRESMTCALKAQSMNSSVPVHFVRSEPVAANNDIKVYDVGQFFVCTVDGTAVPWGKLWVEYDVEFFIPQLPSGGLKPSGGQIVGNTALSGANPLGTGPLLDAQSSGIGVDFTSTVTFLNVGDYVMAVNASGTTITAFGITIGSGVTLIASSVVINAGANSALQVSTLRVTSLTGATARVTATAATITACTCNIGQAPDNSIQP
jgi:hypothetical protein